MQRICVVIPTLNESGNISCLLDRIFEHGDEFDLSAIIVDDGSTDGTREQVNEQAAANRKISLIKREGEKGLGSALIAGFKSHHLEEIEPDIVVSMDGDLSHDPDELPRLIHGCSPGTLVIGSRFIEGGRSLQWGWHRKLISSLVNSYARNVLEVHVHDSTSGYRCYPKGILDDVLPGVVSMGYGFQIDVLSRIIDHGYGVSEIPITFRNRSSGGSKLGLSQAWVFIKEVSRLNRISRLSNQRIASLAQTGR